VLEAHHLEPRRSSATTAPSSRSSSATRRASETSFGSRTARGRRSKNRERRRASKAADPAKWKARRKSYSERHPHVARQWREKNMGKSKAVAAKWRANDAAAIFRREARPTPKSSPRIWRRMNAVTDDDHKQELYDAISRRALLHVGKPYFIGADGPDRSSIATGSSSTSCAATGCVTATPGTAAPPRSSGRAGRWSRGASASAVTSYASATR
jgi:hypothetical protein